MVNELQSKGSSPELDEKLEESISRYYSATEKTINGLRLQMRDILDNLGEQVSNLTCKINNIQTQLDTLQKETSRDLLYIDGRISMLIDTLESLRH